MSETIKGVVEKVFYTNGAWSSIGLLSGREFIKAAGNIVSPVAGMVLTLTGEYTVHPKYGDQFTVTTAKAENIIGQDAIVAYLSSGFINGVGPVIATKIYAEFGDSTISVIENDYKKLEKIKGITPRIAEQIHDMHKDGKVYMDLIAMLKPEITDLQIAKIYEKYKDKAVKVLEENPYRLINDLDGIGFKKADKLASVLGIKGNDPRRINACVLHALYTAAQDGGHCFMYTDGLESAITELAGADTDMNVAANAILDNKKAGNIVIDGENAIYLRGLYNAETTVAKHVKRLLKNKPDKIVSDYAIHKAIKAVQTETGYIIEQGQVKAIQEVFKNSLSVITGGPGTGKTTIVKAILKAWESVCHDNEAALMAPTGKAARRMSEITGKAAATIHKGLEIRAETGGYNETNPHPALLIIVDEASMLDIYIASMLLQAVKNGSRVVLIGDVDQLPPIGPGNFFKDMVESPKVPTARLEVSYRQSGKIGINASRVNNGQGVNSFSFDNSFTFLEARKDNIADLSVEEYLKLANEFGVGNVCYLSPMRTKSSTGVNIINEKIRDAVLPDKEKRPSMKTGNHTLYLGDRVMQNENDYTDNVFNGDVGFVTDISNGLLEVTFDDGKKVKYTNLRKLVLAYAITVHKSQGSEYAAAVVVHNKEHWFMATRNLLYTALSRASEKVVLIGDTQTINKAVGTVDTSFRNTKLKQRIREP